MRSAMSMTTHSTLLSRQLHLGAVYRATSDFHFKLSSSISSLWIRWSCQCSFRSDLMKVHHFLSFKLMTNIGHYLLIHMRMVHLSIWSNFLALFPGCASGLLQTHTSCPSRLIWGAGHIARVRACIYCAHLNIIDAHTYANMNNNQCWCDPLQKADSVFKLLYLHSL